jgi:anti-sigma factor ChrR (cupin superfamily)
VAIKIPKIKTTKTKTPPRQVPREPRPPARLPVTAPPGFALPEKRGWLPGGKQNRVPVDTGGSILHNKV